MDEWLLFRPLIAYVLACPIFVIVALLLLRETRRRDRNDRVDQAEAGS
jgi:hypothetical protein